MSCRNRDVKCERRRVSDRSLGITCVHGCTLQDRSPSGSGQNPAAVAGLARPSQRSPAVAGQQPARSSGPAATAGAQPLRAHSSTAVRLRTILMMKRSSWQWQSNLKTMRQRWLRLLALGLRLAAQQTGAHLAAQQTGAQLAADSPATRLASLRWLFAALILAKSAVRGGIDATQHHVFHSPSCSQRIRDCRTMTLRQCWKRCTAASSTILQPWTASGRQPLQAPRRPKASPQRWLPPPRSRCMCARPLMHTRSMARCAHLIILSCPASSLAHGKLVRNMCWHQVFTCNQLLQIYQRVRFYRVPLIGHAGDAG